MKIKTIYLGNNKSLCQRLVDESKYMEVTQIEHPLSALKMKGDIGLIILEESDSEDDGLWLTRFIKEHLDDSPVLLFAMSSTGDPGPYFRSGADDLISADTPAADIESRLLFLKQNDPNLRTYREEDSYTNRLPVWKRAFDIVFASLALLLLSPLFVLIALLIRFESKGKVFYAAKRIGTGYKTFDFFKFRSMYTGADKKVNALMAENQYSGKSDNPKKKNDVQERNSDGPLLLSDDEMITEQNHLEQKRIKQEASFFKLVNDPRITKVGRFIRNTSIDELPQLFNILKGDMSVVGNRPLPLYEAELLTTDQCVARFLAPAGLTGLWQVSKRGDSGSMSPDERKQLDIDYANNYSFLGDIRIILKTIPAMLQHENV
ncbi:MAG: sugar transferase [Ignavibacteriae bacterium]|nr:MAG: sugar transferase [Ignavibacteriota bacterium]